MFYFHTVWLVTAILVSDGNTGGSYLCDTTFVWLLEGHLIPSFVSTYRWPPATAKYAESKHVVTFKENLNASLYRSADKSLARLWKETSYNDQDFYHYAKTYGYKQQDYIVVVFTS